MRTPVSWSTVLSQHRLGLYTRSHRIKTSLAGLPTGTRSTSRQLLFIRLLQQSQKQRLRGERQREGGGEGNSNPIQYSQSTPVFLPGKSHGQRSLVGYSPLGRKSWTDWATSLLSFYLSEGHCGLTQLWFQFVFCPHTEQRPHCAYTCQCMGAGGLLYRSGNLFMLCL